MGQKAQISSTNTARNSGDLRYHHSTTVSIGPSIRELTVSTPSLQSPEEFAADTGHQSEDTRYLALSSLDDIEQAGAEMMLRDSEEREELRRLTELVKRMLQLDARERIKAAEVLQHPFFCAGRLVVRFEVRCVRAAACGRVNFELDCLPAWRPAQERRPPRGTSHGSASSVPPRREQETALNPHP